MTTLSETPIFIKPNKSTKDTKAEGVNTTLTENRFSELPDDNDDAEVIFTGTEQGHRTESTGMRAQDMSSNTTSGESSVNNFQTSETNSTIKTANNNGTTEHKPLKRKDTIYLIDSISPGRVAQSVGHPTRKSGSWVRYPVWQHTFVSPSAFSRRAVVSYWRKYVHEVLVNRLGGLSLPRKSVVRLTDRPDMTLDVYRGRKTTKQQQQQDSISGHVNPAILGKSTNTYVKKLKAPKLEDLHALSNQVKDAKVVIIHTGINNLRERKQQ